MQRSEDWRREIYRASRLDEYRLYLSGELYDGSEYTATEFVKRMTERQESAKMAAGTAVHSLIETAQYGELPAHADVNGWHVHFDLDAELAAPIMREVPLYREHRGIPLFGRCDAMDAVRIRDTKTTSAIDVDRYLDSYQWRSYLWMSGRTEFVYDIFRVKVEDDIKVVTVLEYVPIKVSAYPRMDRDVEQLLEDFDVCVTTLAIPEIMQRKLAA